MSIDDFDPFADEEGQRNERSLVDAVQSLIGHDAHLPKRPSIPKLPRLPFVRTSVFDVIDGLAERCIKTRSNGLVLGSPGIGKTMAIREMKRRSEERLGPEMAVLKVEPAYRTSLVVILDELAEIVGLNLRGNGRKVATAVYALKRDMRRRPLVIFDEAQNLSLNMASQLLSLSEDANLRMLFVGNEDVVKLVNSEQAALRLISRRLPCRETIRTVLDDDVDRIAELFDVRDREGLTLCREIGAVTFIDGVVNVLQHVVYRRQRMEELACAGPLRAVEIASALNDFPHYRREIDAASKIVAFDPERSTSPSRLPPRRPQ